MEIRSRNTIEVNDSPNRTSWFFGIGINDYEYFPRLKNAVRDVESILDVLIEQYDVQPQNVVLLTNEEANEDDIVAELKGLANQVKEEDKLIIYYSGHGMVDDTIEEGFWVPVDGMPGSHSRYIPNSLIRKYVKHIKAKHILLISDSCFSGSIFDRGGMRSTQAIEDLDQYKSRWALCSGRDDQKVSDGNPGGNSPFAMSILSALKDNTKGDLSISKLSYQVVEQTRSNYRQLPEGNPLFDTGHAGGEYIFRLNDRSTILHNTAEVAETGRSDITRGTKREERERKTEKKLNAGKQKPLAKYKWMFMAIFALIIMGIAGVLYMASRTQNSPENGKHKTYAFSTIDINDLTWMTENLEPLMYQQTGGRWLHNRDSLAQQENLGSLYTYDEAVEACAGLGDGWRLPTKDEWFNLMNPYGTMQKAQGQNQLWQGGDEIAIELMQGGKSGLNLIIGGLGYNDNTFSPSDISKPISNGGFWADQNNYLGLKKETIFESSISFNVMPSIWNHAISCRCVKE